MGSRDSNEEYASYRMYSQETNKDRGGNVLFWGGLAAAILIPSTIIFAGQYNDAHAQLARQRAAIESDGFKVASMPGSFIRDILRDNTQSGQVVTILDLGDCTLEVNARSEINPDTELPDVYDYTTSLHGHHSTVQNRDDLQRVYGGQPCAVIDSVKMK